MGYKARLRKRGEIPTRRNEYEGPGFLWTVIDGSANATAEYLGGMKPGQTYTEHFPAAKTTQEMERYVEGLRRAGLDIGHGNCKYGYRMPVPEKEAIFRDLVIVKNHCLKDGGC